MTNDEKKQLELLAEIAEIEKTKGKLDGLRQIKSIRFTNDEDHFEVTCSLFPYEGKNLYIKLLDERLQSNRKELAEIAQKALGK